MGWKASMILANSEKKLDLNRLFEKIGIYQLQLVDSKSFDSVIYPDDDKIYVGRFNGNTIICMQDIPLESLDERPSRAEVALSGEFPNTDIVTFVLHSAINLWGYSIVKSGEKIRVRAGSAEDGTFVEFGDPLQEEEGLLAQSDTNDNGDRFFTFEGFPDEEFTDDQVGENFIFGLSVKYFGEQLDCSDELFETIFDGYTFSRVKPSIERKGVDVDSRDRKKWWKFW